jgi:hypothetical protein
LGRYRLFWWLCPLPYARLSSFSRSEAKQNGEVDIWADIGFFGGCAHSHMLAYLLSAVPKQSKTVRLILIEKFNPEKKKIISNKRRKHHARFKIPPRKSRDRKAEHQKQIPGFQASPR